MSVYDEEHLYLNFLTKIFQKSSSIARIYKTVIFRKLIGTSTQYLGQVTLGKLFSGVPKFEGEGTNHVTEDELLNFMLNVV